MTNVTLADVGRDARAGCAPGYGGVLCSWCEEKFWMNHGACEECSTVGGGALAAVWIAAVMLGVIGVLTASFMLSNRGADNATKIQDQKKGLTLVHLSGPRSKPFYFLPGVETASWPRNREPRCRPSRGPPGGCQDPPRLGADPRPVRAHAPRTSLHPRPVPVSCVQWHWHTGRKPRGAIL